MCNPSFFSEVFHIHNRYLQGAWSSLKKVKQEHWMKNKPPISFKMYTCTQNFCFATQLFFLREDPHKGENSQMKRQ